MNPYRRDTLLAGMLRQEDRFIGLRDELEWVLARISEVRPSAVSLVGPVGVGKSFLLMYLADPQGARRAFRQAIGERLSDDPDRLLFVRLDFEDVALGRRAGPHLLELLYQETLDQLTELLGVPDARLIPLDRLPDGRVASVAALRAQAQRQLAHAREEDDDSALRERFELALGASPAEALPTLLKYLETWGLRVVFLIDDFDNIITMLAKDDFDHLRALLASASLVIVTRKALSKLVPAEIQTSPFFNLVQRLDLRSLYFWPLEEARRVITEPPKWIADAPIRFSASDVEFILKLTGQHPDLIVRTCEDLYMRYRRRPLAPGDDLLPPAERDVVRVQIGALFADTFAAWWYSLGDGERAMLKEIADDRVTIENTLTPALHAVITMGYVVCVDGRYRLFSDLFRDFVIETAGATPNAATAPVRAALTDLEQRLLDILSAQHGETVDRDEIIAALYDTHADNGNARQYYGRLEALIFRLRGKLGTNAQQIDSIRGQGYRLVTTRG
jgi:Transcriptional regulatory protein, C terminal/AAA ATPase domain